MLESPNQVGHRKINDLNIQMNFNYRLHSKTIYMNRNNYSMKRFVVKQNSHKLSNKNLISLKARIFGYLAGDGYVSILKGGNGYNYYEINFYPDDYSTLVMFVEAFRVVYRKEPAIYRYKNKRIYYVRCRDKKICKELLSIARFKSLEWNIPFKLLKNVKSKKEWLRAFFDCEAHVARKQIQLQSVNFSGLKQVQKLLQHFSIESKIYKYERKNKKWNTNYILCIMKRESRKNYLKKIGFNHSKKKEKLESILKAGMAESGKRAR